MITFCKILIRNGEQIDKENINPVQGQSFKEQLISAGMKEYVADKLISDPNSRVHIYGKKEVRPGRKMGHINTVIT